MIKYPLSRFILAYLDGMRIECLYLRNVVTWCFIFFGLIHMIHVSYYIDTKKCHVSVIVYLHECQRVQ